MKKDVNKKNEKVTLNEIRDSFYSRRDFEISNLWQRSVFLTAFLVLCFTGYGYLLTNFINVCNFQLLHEIACGISLLGITFSVIWIKMAKGSKAWYEVYEKKIIEIEQEKELEIPEKYRMGGTAEQSTQFCVFQFFHGRDSWLVGFLKKNRRGLRSGRLVG